MRASWRVWAAAAAGVAVIWTMGRLGPIGDYVDAVKGGVAASVAYDAAPEQAWMQRLQKEAARQRIEPRDATIDRVWKAIPGYNGLEADPEATYAQMRAIGWTSGQPIPWVYREIAPKVGLEDLPLMPIYRGHPDKPMVGLMINVAWKEENLPAMLKTLDDAGVKATFFFDGSWLSRHLDLARDIRDRGHELANHAYTHPEMSRLSAERQRQEIARTERLLREELGVETRWFAPPSGDYNETTVRVAGELGLRTVLWTLDTIDWREPPAASIVRKVADQAGNGALILMHPTASARDALAGMIAAIRAKGLIPGTVGETLSPARARATPPPGPARADPPAR